MKSMKTILALLMSVLLLASTLTACAKSDEVLEKVEITEEKTNYVAIQVADHGTIVVELFPDIAPITVANFQKLVSENFYDGLTFHRVIKNFMIQGGDPKGNGTGGSDEEIKGEFTANGISNNLSHVRGVISMARSEEMDSASSQFFICHADSLHLDGNYAAFGRVIYGIEIVDSIASVQTNYMNNKPVKAVTITSIDFVTLKETPETFAPTTMAPEQEDFNDTLPDAPAIDDPSKIAVSEGATNYVSIEVENHGTIIVELLPDVAPITVANFKKLVGEGFYDGLIFHRVIKDFMIQGGDPEGTGMGGSDETIKGEFSANGVQNDLSHVRGVISMARNSISMDSASSQFFICHEDATSLDGQYAAFGRVIFGMDTVDSIASVETGRADKATTDVTITSMKFLDLKPQS